MLCSDRRHARRQDIDVFAGAVRLSGTLSTPAEASGLVVFAHGSGSSRASPRNQLVAGYLNDARLASLLFDLLTPAEQAARANVFDIDLLGGRLADATRWIADQAAVSGLPIGYFGASTGAAAALWAATESDLDVRAIVARGGRPDLAEDRLSHVVAPTLLIVGGRDSNVLTLNWRAARRVRAQCRVAVVPGATHLFEEPGTLQAAAELACEWFARHLDHAATPEHRRRSR
ncbi:MAG TPA: hypothetical protein VHI95_09960 [Acidimicrobiales bacterium]|jgi:putative phosphoribosyl transferase|nr:hypothetical protein [Acidimicrobiales bacterium]